MELRVLEYALVLAQEKNFSKAAEKLHIAQPSLSQQIKKLEQEVGIQLFERRPGDIELTYAGRRFIDQAAKILDHVEQLKKEMIDVAEMKKGQLIIGSLPITGSHLLPLALPLFQKQYPGIELVLIEETTSNLESLTAKGHTDISLLSLPILAPGVEGIPLLEEEILLAVPPSHPLAKQKQVNLVDFQNDSFILLKKGQGFRQIAEQLCQQAGFQPNVVFESTNIETIQSLVSTGMGVSFVPKMVARSNLSQGLAPVYLQIGNDPPTRTLVIGYKKGRYLSKAALAFIDVMKEVAKQLK
ncbi:LysR family transcriptional regulator [Tepidibacillus fermentans]|uniref:DNA-binding transcriptional LysR family regulator n=1 Tax=Tepidibacillus fermentans TaxID=1281767 RepID=A0A4R3KM03_9BACI|nr:LysR family transcriptional regulator [Tepidibacillus fermentans]TCS84476.1 DNA-binding transcriptional LysR family regulator [Tepidibacillus fermentans]